MGFWSKRIKNKKSIANALGVDESKIEALMNNELEIGGETMNKTLKAIEEEKINKAIRESDIWKWIQETDFRQKRLEFGYKTIKEVAKLIGVSDSTISRLETDKSVYPKLTPTLTKIYEFYQNDFNKNGGIIIKPSVDRSKKRNKENKDIWKWYKNTDVKSMRIQKGVKTALDFAKVLGTCPSCISDLERKKMKRVNDTMLKAYNYLVNNEIIEQNIIEDESKKSPKISVPVANRGSELPVETKSDEQYARDLELKIEYLTKLNEKYETLIDKLIGRL